LALAISLAGSNFFSLVVTLILSLAFFIAMIKVMPSLLRKIEQKFASGQGDSIGISGIVVIILLTALCTEAIGIHALFGPFLLGALISKQSLLAKELHKKLETLTVTLLLPVFFAFTGMKTQLGLVLGSELWLWCLGLIAVASLGKIGGASVAARLSGVAWRDAFGIGILMNTRGLMELIVLNIGLELKILSPTLFSMMVIMAIATTLMTTPLFSWLTKKHPWH
jgi:Kef-type K+ transport system membrane component KefB